MSDSDMSSAIYVLVGFAVLVLLAWGVTLFVMDKKKQDQAAADAKFMEEERIAQVALIEGYVEQHFDAILLRARRVSFVNEYGQRDLKPLFKEATYFFDNVATELRDRVQGGHRQYWIERLVEHMVIVLDEEGELASRAGDRSDGINYERDVGAEFARQGFAVSYTPRTGDQGVDLVATRADTVVAIQCKDYRGTVGNDAVQQVFAGASFYRATNAVVVAPTDYTPSARALAQQLNVALLHHSEIAQQFSGSHPLEAREA